MEGIESGSRQGKRVVVIGGGILAAKLLQFHADVTLIDPKEYFEITWASLRSMVEPTFAERTVINHKSYLKQGRVVTSPAINITETEDGSKTRQEKLSHYQAEYEKIKSSGSVLIVGGEEEMSFI